ncbi:MULTISPECIES: hypothetical protein [unclassified Bradyrhizobium]|uniref:hypothetical protein n=1 Tax=unclassified Bradyrhizobium TaxID=2631580 RepID=UPI003393B890
MRGFELKQRLAELAKRHNVAPSERPAMALLSRVTVPQIVDGIAATPDVDSDRMSFARGSLSWPALDQLPLLVRHNPDKSAGKILDLTYSADGRLLVKAQVDDQEARCMPAFSIAATVSEAEIVNEGSFAFYALIHRAVVNEISLTPQPANAAAIVTRRRDVTPLDLTHDAAVAAITRLRKHLAVVALQAAPQAPLSPRVSIGTAPAYIHGTLPAAVLKPRRSEFSRLVASLPTGDGP